jgi:feruloyl esterase
MPISRRQTYWEAGLAKSEARRVPALGTPQITRFSVAALLCGTFIAMGAASQVGTPADAQSAAPAGAEACGSLAALKLDQALIDSAQFQAAKAEVSGARRPGMTGEPDGAPVADLPAFCRVTGSLHPEPGSDIRFEVWLPLEGWNGRLFGANNGGFAGSLRFDDLAAAVVNGAIGVSTDGGHKSSDRTWSVGRPERVRDYGWRATHVSTVLAKQIGEKFYGRQPDKSYFVGCSNGGRQALMAASRFPEDFDGVVAGAPAATWTGAGLAMLNAARAQAAPGAAIRRDQAALLQGEVRRQCDGLDGKMDGIIDDPRLCKLDYSKLECGVSSSAQCFSPPQIAALRQIHAGYRNKAGTLVAFGFPPSGGEVGDRNAGWDTSIMSARGDMTTSLLTQFTPQPIATPETFSFETDIEKYEAALGGDLDARPDLSRFFARGGKLIMWHGWADPILTPQISLDFHQKILARSGPRAKTSMRFFMVPGQQHCAGGPGADSFGQIGAAPPGAKPEDNVAAALVDWVELRRTPETLIGRHAVLRPAGSSGLALPHFERLFCAYPAVPVLRAGADRDKAASYTCRMPPRGGRS